MSIKFNSDKKLTIAEIKANIKPIETVTALTPGGYEYTYNIYYVVQNKNVAWFGKFTGMEKTDKLVGNSVKFEDEPEYFIKDGVLQPMGKQVVEEVKRNASDGFRQQEKLAVEAKIEPKKPPVVKKQKKAKSTDADLAALEGEESGLPDIEIKSDNYVPAFTKRVKKAWGEELIFLSTERFCVKHLVFLEKGNYCSLHFHKKKYEEWVVYAGSFAIEFMKPTKGKYDLVKNPITKKVFKPGDVIKIDEKLAHRMTSLEDNSILLEVSTADSEEDNVRLIPSMEPRV